MTIDRFRGEAALIVLFLGCWTPAVGMAAEYFVAPDGLAENRGTEESPWDIESAWAGSQTIQPGSTIYMKGGTYRHPNRTWAKGSFEIKVFGEEGSPVHIRPLPGARVTIDGAVIIANEVRHLRLWDLEITVSDAADWDRRVPHAGADPRPHRDLPAGGLVVHGGRDSKFINLVIHSTPGTGVSFWRGAVDAELHGCLIYDNGLIATDRYHGPGIYTQNERGQKWITDNILWGNYSTTLQAYGSSNAYVNGFRVIGNVSFGPRVDGGRQRFLIGGGRPSEDIVVRENVLHRVPLQIGYTAPHNEDAVVEENVVIDAGLNITRFRQVKQANNRLIGDAEKEGRESADVWLRPNKYDKNRANLVIANWTRQASVDVDPQPFLQPGDTYRLVRVIDFFGPPAAEGMYDGGRLSVPVDRTEETADGEFGVYVLFRDYKGGLSPFERYAALYSLGVVRWERARALIAQSKSPGQQKPSKSLDEARELLSKAQDHFVQARADLATELQTFGDSFERIEDPQLRERRNQLRAKYIKIYMLEPAVLEQTAETFSESSDERRNTLLKAAEGYKEIHDKYGDYVLGVYAQMYRARCYQKVGEYGKALDDYTDLLDMSDVSPELRMIKVQTLALAMECWMHPSMKRYQDAISHGGKWLANAEAAEKRDPTGLAVQLAMARAHWSLAESLPEADKQKRRSLEAAQDLAREVARHPGESREPARQLLAEIGDF